jgi:hypothetical protein
VGGRESEIVCATSSWSRAVSPVGNRASGRLVSVPALTSRGRNERGAERSERERERERERGLWLSRWLLARSATLLSTIHRRRYPSPRSLHCINTHARSTPTHSLDTYHRLHYDWASLHSFDSDLRIPTYISAGKGSRPPLKRAFHPIPTRRLGSILQHCFGQQYAAIQVNSTGYIAETVVIETCELETRLRTRRAVTSTSTVVLHHEALDSHASTD